MAARATREAQRLADQKAREMTAKQREIEELKQSMEKLNIKLSGAAATTGGTNLTKNQKKRMKQKQKKAAAKAAAGGATDPLNTSMATDGDADGDGDGDDDEDEPEEESTKEEKKTDDAPTTAAAAASTSTEATVEEKTTDAADTTTPATSSAAATTSDAMPAAKSETESGSTAGPSIVTGSETPASPNDAALPSPASSITETDHLTHLIEQFLNGETPEFHTKIADLGNGCWIHKHFTDDVTTRQYRAPEVLTGYPYSTPLDIWSTSCLVFEMLTGDYLFDPREDPQGKFTRDEDHLALMSELLGRMPKKLTTQGKYSKEMFNKKGDLKHIKQLELWGLEDVLLEKYKFPAYEAKMLASFLLPMLELDPDRRVTAAEALKHPWLYLHTEVEYKEYFNQQEKEKEERRIQAMKGNGKKALKKARAKKSHTFAHTASAQQQQQQQQPSSTPLADDEDEEFDDEDEPDDDDEDDALNASVDADQLNTLDSSLDSLQPDELGDDDDDDDEDEPLEGEEDLEDEIGDSALEDSVEYAEGAYLHAGSNSVRTKSGCDIPIPASMADRPHLIELYVQVIERALSGDERFQSFLHPQVAERAILEAAYAQESGEIDFEADDEYLDGIDDLDESLDSSYQHDGEGGDAAAAIRQSQLRYLAELRLRAHQQDLREAELEAAIAAQQAARRELEEDEEDDLHDQRLARHAHEDDDDALHPAHPHHHTGTHHAPSRHLPHSTHELVHHRQVQTHAQYAAAAANHQRQNHPHHSHSHTSATSHHSHSEQDDTDAMAGHADVEEDATLPTPAVDSDDGLANALNSHPHGPPTLAKVTDSVDELDDDDRALVEAEAQAEENQQ